MSVGSSLRESERIYRVVVVDDSEIFSTAIVDLYSEDRHIEVVGRAATGNEAIQLIKALKPDVVSLDLGLPDVDGFEVCRRIMAEQPTPFLVLTATLNPAWRREAYYAISLGAIDVVKKPTAREFGDAQWRRGMCKRLKFVARAPVVPHVAHRRRERAQRRCAAEEELSAPGDTHKTQLIVVVGSAGSPSVVTQLLAYLATIHPLPVPMVVVLHVGRMMGESFARYLCEETGAPARVLAAEQRIEPGIVYVAPGGSHVEFKSRGCARSFKNLPAARYVPSIDHFLWSVAKHYGADAMGFILTGMGDDGAQGMLQLHRVGGRAFAQDEHSCLVASMPRAAREAGGIIAELTVEEMGKAIIRTIGSARPTRGQGE